MAARSSSKPAVYAALIGNLLVALTKFAAAAWTGSSAMFSEGIHSLVDTSNQALLLYGFRRAERPPDADHPLGHGRELYFWSFVVALLTFMLGAGVSVYQGFLHMRHPQPVVDPQVNYVVLALSALFEGASWWVALRNFRRDKAQMGYLEAVRRSKDPPAFVVLLEDTAALVGLLFAFAGTFLAERLDLPALDGAASIAIGLVLGTSALIVARESKELLIGESAQSAISRSIVAIAKAEPGIERVNEIITVHLAPRQIVAMLSLDFADDLRTPDIEARVASLEAKIKTAHPDVTAVFIKPQAASTERPRPQHACPSR
jgi:cation diffusion facilitator family transporter